MALLLIVVATLFVMNVLSFQRSGFSLAVIGAYVIVRVIYTRMSQQKSLSIIDMGLNERPRRAESPAAAPSEVPVAPDALTVTRRARSIPADEPSELRVEGRHNSPLIPEELQRALGEAYVVRDELGRGGFGVVYWATDSVLGRELAIKVVCRDQNHDAMVRFQLEATILANLRHSHIVPVHFFGSTQHFVFMVMPRIFGQSLRGRIKSRYGVTDGRITIHDLTFAEIDRILAQTASALDVAHRANVVHRDVKPENLLLEGPSQHVQVVDFGVAKLIDPQRPARRGTIIGTWDYMSPEQWTGSSDIDHGSDIYSLGCVVYEMLAGQPPFVAARSGPWVFQDYQEAHLHQQPPPIRQWRQDCPAQVERAVLKALAKQRKDRFQSAGEFAEAFGAQ